MVRVWHFYGNMVWKKQNVLDLRKIFDGSNGGFGATDIEVGLGKGHFEVIRNVFGLLRHFLPLVPNVRRQLLVLRAPHLSPVLHRVRVRFAWKRRCEGEWRLWRVSELGHLVAVAQPSRARLCCGSLFKINASSVFTLLGWWAWAGIGGPRQWTICWVLLHTPCFLPAPPCLQLKDKNSLHLCF